MRFLRKHLVVLAGMFFLAGCGNGDNRGTSSSSGSGGIGDSGGAGGAGGAGGSGGSGGGSTITIEKPENAIDGQYIFVLDESKVTPDMVKSVAEALLASQAGTLLQVYDGVFLGFAASGLDDTKAIAISKDPRITSIMQDYVMQADELQTGAPWGVDRVDSHPLALDNTYEYYLTGAGVHVYVIDSGVRPSHQDFGGRVLAAESVTYVNDASGIGDCNSHGTHVAGIVGGTTYGVAKGVTLHSVRVANCTAQSTGSQVLAAINWVTTNHKKPAIVNMSMSGSAASILDMAVVNSINAGVTYVVAAGNKGKMACNYSPARVPQAITVAATDNTDNEPSWSNFGSCVDIYAPGAGILSATYTTDTDSATKSGTSMAAPHVAGVAALYLQLNPGATPAAVQAALVAGATPNVVQNPSFGSPNRLLYSRFMEPKGSFAGTKSWDAYYTDAGLWKNAPYGNTIQYADLDGDKKMDICGRAVNGIVCELSMGTTFGSPQVWDPGYSDSNGWNVANMYETIRFPDLDGDGRADICGRGTAGLYCGLSNGANFQPISLWDTYFTDAGPWNDSPAYWQTIQFADVNGDKKMDVCGRAANGVVCELSTGGSFNSLAPWATGFSDANGWQNVANLWGTIRFPDLNGDGKADVCGRAPLGLTCGLSNGTTFEPMSYWDDYFTDTGPWDDSSAYWATIQYADIDGDKKMDVCGRAQNGIVCRRSTGTSFGPVELWSQSFNDADGWAGVADHWGTISFPDINGDGRADVCGRSVNGIMCAQSTGSKFAYNATWDPTFSNANGWAADPTYWGLIRYPDINGDGKADICGRRGSGVECGISSP